MVPHLSSSSTQKRITRCLTVCSLGATSTAQVSGGEGLLLSRTYTHNQEIDNACQIPVPKVPCPKLKQLHNVPLIDTGIMRHTCFVPAPWSWNFFASLPHLSESRLLAAQWAAAERRYRNKHGCSVAALDSPRRTLLCTSSLDAKNHLVQERHCPLRLRCPSLASHPAERRGNWTKSCPPLDMDYFHITSASAGSAAPMAIDR